jgi:hypothetical protein
MPHLIFRGITAQQVQAISIPLTDELARLCRCPREDILLEVMHTTAVSQGEISASYPFVEAAWFDRGEEIRDRFAEIVDRHLRQAGVAESEIAFRVYREDHYYLNGRRADSIREKMSMPAADAASASAAGTTSKPAGDVAAELAAAREENARLREQLRKASRKFAAHGAESSMSTRLRDALRE